MKIHRIYAILLRYLFFFRHSLDRLSDAFYWPTIDLVIWGITSSYLKTIISSTQPIVILIISGIVLWYVVWRAEYELSVNVLEDIWDRNLINIFVSPLKFSEWLTSLLLLGVIKAFISLLLTSLVALLLYKVHIFSYGFYLIPFFTLLMMTGWAVGFFVTGLILRFGARIQTLAWSLVALISPFCAIYYPLSALPGWAQKVAIFIPASYIFEGMRQVVNSHTLDPQKLYMSLILNIIYMILALIYLRKSFSKILQKGLINID